MVKDGGWEGGGPSSTETRSICKDSAHSPTQERIKYKEHHPLSLWDDERKKQDATAIKQFLLILFSEAMDLHQCHAENNFLFLSTIALIVETLWA